MNSTLAATLVQALGGAVTAGTTTPTVAGSILANLFHTQASSAGLDVTKKTITTTFYNNNTATAITLLGEGFTLIPG